MNNRAKIRVLVGFACLSFILLGLLAYFFPHTDLDVYISKEIQEEVNEERFFSIAAPLTYVSVFGNYGISALCVLGMSLLFLITANRRESLFVLFVFMADAVSLLLKVIINRPRPTENLVYVAAKFDHSSFPSGHVSHYVVFFGFLLVVLLYKKYFPLPVRAVLALFLLLLIGTIPISRIYLGAHWFTDVMGGYLAGSILLYILLGFYFKSEGNQSRWRKIWHH